MQGDSGSFYKKLEAVARVRDTNQRVLDSAACQNEVHEVGLKARLLFHSRQHHVSFTHYLGANVSDFHFPFAFMRTFSSNLMGTLYM